MKSSTPVCAPQRRFALWLVLAVCSATFVLQAPLFGAPPEYKLTVKQIDDYLLSKKLLVKGNVPGASSGTCIYNGITFTLDRFIAFANNPEKSIESLVLLVLETKRGCFQSVHFILKKGSESRGTLISQLGPPQKSEKKHETLEDMTSRPGEWLTYGYLSMWVMGKGADSDPVRAVKVDFETLLRAHPEEVARAEKELEKRKAQEKPQPIKEKLRKEKEQAN
jgi:hypothetical protein